MTRMAALNGHDTSLLRDLGPSSDESVLIFIIDGALSQQDRPTPAAPVRTADRPCGLYSTCISQASDPYDFIF